MAVLGARQELVVPAVAVERKKKKETEEEEAEEGEAEKLGDKALKPPSVPANPYHHADR